MRADISAHRRFLCQLGRATGLTGLIPAAAASAGRGTVVLSAGTYFSHSLRLQSNVAVHLAPGFLAGNNVCARGEQSENIIGFIE